MDTPKIDAALGTVDARISYHIRMHEGVVLLEQGFQNKKIWNVDFEDAKYSVNRACEQALDAVMDSWRAANYHTEPRPTWMYNNKDPRHDVSPYVSPLHAAGLLKRLQHKKVTPSKELIVYTGILAEVALIGQLLKEAKPFIVKGRKPSTTPAPEPDLSNTGICPICLHRQKLSFEATMVDHGYTVPQGYGGRNGHCLGFKYQPYELSCEGNIFYKGILEQDIRNYEESIRQLEAGEVPEFERVTYTWEQNRRKSTTIIVKKGEPRYGDCVREDLSRAKMHLGFIKETKQEQERLIAHWTLKTLKYGGAETQERWIEKLKSKNSQ